MKLVILESPYADDVERNKLYARLCMHDCFLRGEAPFASHLLYTQPHILDDDKDKERELGINAGLLWGKVAKLTVIYSDFGISVGMKYGIENAIKAKRPVEYRQLPKCILDKNFDKSGNIKKP